MPSIVISLILLAATAASPRADSTPRVFGSGTPAIRYVILGDSTAVAIGGTYENGLAIASARHLATRGTVELINAAVSGARIHDVLTEQIPRVELTNVDVVLVDVGANDVIHLTRSGAFERDLQRVIELVREKSPRAKIIVTGSADMGSPPRIPRLLRPLSNFRTRRLNAIVDRLVAKHGLTFAPIAEKTGPAFRADRTLFSDDRFHPNDRGYALWTTVINEALDRAFSRSAAALGGAVNGMRAKTPPRAAAPH
jgi:lysophospholipase L1-like esterase